MLYDRGRQPLARVPNVARELIFYGTPSDFILTKLLTCYSVLSVFFALPSSQALYNRGKFAIHFIYDMIS